MNRMTPLSNRIRGWLPKEPTVPTCQKPVIPKNSPIVQWTARALVAGTVACAALLVVGDILGLTEGVGGYVWYMVACGVVWVPAAATPFLVNRKEKRRGGTKDWVS